MHSEDSPSTLALTDRSGATPSRRRYRFEVVSGPDEGQSIERDRGTVLFGTHPSNDLVVQDPAVSRYHAELRILPEGALLVDRGSTNGTRLGGRRVDRVLIPPGGRFSAGKTVIAVHTVSDTAASGGTDQFGAFVTRAPSAQRVLTQLRLVSESDATVLLTGETGTGKELLARALHDHSPRKSAPFVVVDCGAVSPTLLESELFGHERGAFTGAHEARVGAFEAAEGGTVFLDELGELPVDLQPKLLRVLEARTVRRLGQSEERPVDVRFVAATHRNLESLVKSGGFREDLFYRVAVVRVQIPPLRERPEDVGLLAQSLAERMAGRRIELDEAAVVALQAYDWPGNVRELRNVIERSVALAGGGRLGPAEIFSDQPSSGPSGAFRDVKDRVIAEFESRYVRSLLARHPDNVSGAAREAGLSRNALYALMKRAGVDGPKR